ncbi:12956_t:CDS:1, partial [Dentiscutata erythropus]
KVEVCGYNVEAMRNRLERAVINGQFISEYDNEFVVFKPDSVWRA